MFLNIFFRNLKYIVYVFLTDEKKSIKKCEKNALHTKKVVKENKNKVLAIF